MFASLGQLSFEVLASPSKWETSDKYEFAQIDVIGASPMNQWIFDDLQKITLTIGFHAFWCHPTGALEQLRALAATHMASTFVLGNGTNLGKFIIDRIDVNYKWMADDGTLIYAEVEIRLNEDIQDNAPPGAPLADAVALGLPTPALINPMFSTPGSALNSVPASAAPAGIDYNTTSYSSVPLQTISRSALGGI
jgi:phage protein U